MRRRDFPPAPVLRYIDGMVIPLAPYIRLRAARKMLAAAAHHHARWPTPLSGFYLRNARDAVQHLEELCQELREISLRLSGC